MFGSPSGDVTLTGQFSAHTSSCLWCAESAQLSSCYRPFRADQARQPRRDWSLAQNLVSILRRAGPADPTEHPREVLLCLESARYCDIKNPHLGLAQHVLCTLYPLPQDKLMRALAGRLPKHLQEMRCAEPCTLRHFVEGQLFFDLCVHQLRNPS